MKFSYIKLLAILLVLVAFSACEKVITVNLNDSAPVVVVEGTLCPSDSFARVELSYSVNFDQTNTFPPVEKAIVTISNTKGNIYTLTEFGEKRNADGSLATYISPGNYRAKLQAQIGETYLLTIIANGKTYTSTSTIPPIVPIDSIYVSGTGGFSPPDVSDSYMSVAFQDPVGVPNYYRFVQYVNDKNSVPDPYIFVGDDHLEDGMYLKAALFGSKVMIEKGDTIAVATQFIDKGVCDYFQSLANLGQQGQGATPTNPKSNITGGALGYFSAYSEVRNTIIFR